MDDDKLLNLVMADLYGTLPRQGPGSVAVTRHAFSMLGPLPERPLVLDIGCGTGRQTMELAMLTDGHIIGLDIFDWALDALSRKVVEAGLVGRVHTIKQSMMEMDFREETFDLIWAEGSLYIMGFENALSVCRRLLKRGGYLAASELCWLRDDPPEELRLFLQREYPGIKMVGDNIQCIAETGYDLLGHFTLPDRAWWGDYYIPMRKRLKELRVKYTDCPNALALFAEADREMDMRRKYARWYGYEFFLCRCPLG
ncbi:MAG TPA: class I SAM-dependent methyltransferase [Dehalococcoidia bacterium]|nr:class I SAM-dependent methyltransferase [Dehalococcoidia bacterium]